MAISHPPKAAPAKAIHAVTGSLAYVAAARLVFLVVDEPESESGRRLLLATKSNLGALAAGLGYHLIQRLVGPKANIVASYVHWDAAVVTMTAGEAMHGSSDDGARAALRAAKDFLRGALSAGEAPATAIEDEAKARGISIATLRRAREALGVRAVKTTFVGGWVWSLPRNDN